MAIVPWTIGLHGDKPWSCSLLSDPSFTHTFLVPPASSTNKEQGNWLLPPPWLPKFQLKFFTQCGDTSCPRSGLGLRTCLQKQLSGRAQKKLGAGRVLSTIYPDVTDRWTLSRIIEMFRLYNIFNSLSLVFTYWSTCIKFQIFQHPWQIRWYGESGHTVPHDKA